MSSISGGEREREDVSPVGVGFSRERGQLGGGIAGVQTPRGAKAPASSAAHSVRERIFEFSLVF